MGGASESRDLDGEPQPYRATSGDTSDTTSENLKSCRDAADISRKRTPGGDGDRTAAKTRQQEGGSRIYGRSDIDGGDSGGVNVPIGNDEGSGSTGTHGRAAGDGSNKDRDAHTGNAVRDDSSGRAGNGNDGGGVESAHRGSDSESADASGDHIARTSEDKGHGAGASSQRRTPGIGTMDHSPEDCATRRDEPATTQAGLATPGVEAEVTEEVAPGRAAAAAATNGKRKSGQQSRLSRNARKRYRKSLDKT